MAKTERKQIERELRAMSEVFDALIPLSKPDQARVLLLCITKFAPDAFTEQQLMHLVRVASEKS